jgi:hypothetical protein
VREETAADAAPSITALKRQQVAQPLAPTRAPSAPEPPAPAARDAATQADAGPAASLSREALAPAPAAPGASRKSLLPGAERAKALALPVPAATGGVARCGVVRDPQGRPLAHVAVTFVGRARVARTDAEGRFCLEMPASGGQLALDAVGFESRRLTLGPAVPGEDLVLALDPVPVLGVAPLARDGRGGAARAGDEDAVRAAPGATGAELALPAPDLRLEPDTVRVLFQRARTLRREVGARPTAGQWEAIAAVWDAAGDHADDREVVARARYEGLAARMRAWRLDPSPARHRLAAAAVATLEAAAPTGPLRTAAERWGRELRP